MGDHHAAVAHPPLDRQRARVPRRQPGWASAGRAARRGRHRHHRRRPGQSLFRRPREPDQLVHRGLERQRQHLAQEPARGAELVGRPAVVHRRQRADLGRLRQHDLPRLPRDPRRHVHLLQPGLDRPGRPRRRPGLAERVGQFPESSGERHHVRADALRQGEAQPLLPVQRRRPHANDDRARGARAANGNQVLQRCAPGLAGRRRAGSRLPGCRHGFGRQRLRGLDRHRGQQRLLLGLDRSGDDLDSTGEGRTPLHRTRPSSSGPKRARRARLRSAGTRPTRSASPTRSRAGATIRRAQPRSSGGATRA